MMRRSSSPAPVRPTAALVAAALSIAGCHAPLTQVVVVVESDLASVDIARVRVEIGPAGAPTSERTVRIAEAPSGPGESGLPFSFGLRARVGREGEQVLVRVAALDESGAVTVRTRALVPFVRGETRRVVLHLERACR
ncbi:MAG: hypothetical protein M3Y87_35575, partial [Myxococcota bacterium]|nr:hypothetical protein [Myxococcota bacterium]